ncbi:MAG: guanylate kinase [Candidatus Omnitrophica bacterium]|nr:guanylate kinase [Candidatus Omnitrophota bacterium]
MRRQGRVFVISSPSGGGKTTVVKWLTKQLPGLSRSVSVTTRPPRAKEKRGHDYQFVPRPVFEELRQSNAFLEWANVHGAFYGTLKGSVTKALQKGQNVILSIDVQGAKQVRKALKKQSVLIFLLPPSLKQLRQRLLSRRTETASSLRQRLAAARSEVACARWYDYVVTNDRLPETLRAVQAIIVAHSGNKTAAFKATKRR